MAAAINPEYPVAPSNGQLSSIVSDLPTARVSFRDSASKSWPRQSPDDNSDIPTNEVDLSGVDVGLAFPNPGQRFQGFEILSELGRGAMGRVFLARQQAPTERVVVLKLGHYLTSECQKLAKLEHPNIVPVYSFHEYQGLQAVCMPYRGPLTLGHLVSRLRHEQFQTMDGRSLTTMIEECRKVRQPTIIAETPTPASTTELKTILPEDTVGFPGLKGLNYVDSVLTVIRQVVEGLRVAHAEQIVHSDLKPANVLISDDGCAQLIDFGVSFDRTQNSGSERRLGGTRPYMSPEQLQSFLTRNVEHDERSDLYAVGAMLYELLTGQLPYVTDYDSAEPDIQREQSLRFDPPKKARSFNPRVPVAVESIIEKCLAPHVADRYQTAGQLHEDLDRQIARRPLRYAPNLSRQELVGKWVSRNRVFLVAGGLLTLTGAVAAGSWRRDAIRTDEIRRLEVVSATEPFARDLEEAEFAFGLSDRDPTYRTKAWESARRALDRFSAWNNPDWYQRPEFQRLSEDRLATIRQQSAGLMLQLANSQGQQAAVTADATERSKLLSDATEWNRRAERTHPNGEGLRAIWFQRAYLARLEGNTSQAAAFAKRVETLPQNSAESVLEGRQLLAEGRHQDALKAFKAATQADPKLFWAAFYTGVTHQRLNEFREAVTAFDTCATLRPGFFGTEFNRGLCRLRLGQVHDAESDFDRVITSRPDWADAYFQRAIAREAQKRYDDAIVDLNFALEFGYTPTSVYLVRSRVAGRMGDKKTAESDFTKGIETLPTDERGWLARAQAQLYRNPTAALADYDEVLKLNPRQAIALQGKAHVLSGAQKNREALAVITQLIELTPDSAYAWGGRGVVKARLNDREGAIADGREALRLTQHPATKYQVAGIYAMTSRTHREDRPEAYSLLDSALREGFGFEHLAEDHELDPIRNEAEFQRIVAAARKYRDSLKK